jgi:stalled ribosome alternative rescue factor ArfA
MLQEEKRKLATRNADPWLVRLERVRGRIGDDGVERLSSQTLFDHLEVLQRSRGAGAYRRLARVMRELGWTPVRLRDLTRGGYKEQVRGYCRDARCRFN